MNIQAVEILLLLVIDIHNYRANNFYLIQLFFFSTEFKYLLLGSMYSLQTYTLCNKNKIMVTHNTQFQVLIYTYI